MFANNQKKKCLSCEDKNIKKLSDQEISEMFSRYEITLWKNIDDNQIEREFEFEDFKTNFDFVTKIADLSEEEGHHPDIYIFYNKTKITLYTHSISGLSENDFILAHKIDQIHQMFFSQK